jgi:hypothetical protein
MRRPFQRPHSRKAIAASNRYVRESFERIKQEQPPEPINMECSECPAGDCSDCPRKTPRWYP